MDQTKSTDDFGLLPAFVEGWLNVLDAGPVKDPSLVRSLNVNRGQKTPSWQPQYCILHLAARKLVCFPAEQEAAADNARKFAEGKSTKIVGTRQELLATERDRETCERQWRHATMQMSSHSRDKKHNEKYSTGGHRPRHHPPPSPSSSSSPAGRVNPITGGGSSGFTRSRRAFSFRNRLTDDEFVVVGGLRNSFHLDAAYEKPAVIGLDRRGSVPSVISCVSSSTADPDSLSITSSTPSRFMNYLNRKSTQLKDNLKITKSATKLDRKRTNVLSDEHISSACDSNETSSYNTAPAPIKSTPPTVSSSTPSTGSSLKRAMSLSRLSRRWHNKPRIDKQSATCDSSTSAETPRSSRPRLQAARSHESLLSPHPSSAAGDSSNLGGMPSLSLGNGSIDVRPLPTNVFDRDHCFEVATESGAKYFSCKDDTQRHEWIKSFQSAFEPLQGQKERTEHQLKLCLSEAKNIPTKYKYFCEICLDKTLYARTTSRQNVDMLFWGEQFDLVNLPSVDHVTINIYREVDKRKKKDSHVFIGYVDIPTSQIDSRQPTERWYPVALSPSSGIGKNGQGLAAGDLPMIRIKALYQSVRILPIIIYKSMIEFLQSNYKWTVKLLEPALSNIRGKEELATLLVNVLHKDSSAKDFLVDIIMEDVKNQDNQKIIFRANSIATKAMEAYMKLVGQKYLQDTLGEFVRMVIESTESFEVDPVALAASNSASELQRRRNKLVDYCQRVWFKIFNSHLFVPYELKEVFASLREHCRQQDASGDLGRQLITSCIFLRFLCPAILSPSLFGLAQTLPQQRAMRNLTLIAKTIQGLANFTRFGGKEEYMTFMNSFVEAQTPNMKEFLDKISVCSGNSSPFDGAIDLGKESSMLHTALVECLDKVTEAPCDNLTRLRDIVAAINSVLSPSGNREPTSNGSGDAPESTKTKCAGHSTNGIKPAPVAAPRVTLSSVSDASDTTPSPRYISNTSMKLSLAGLPPVNGNHNQVPSRTRTTMREMQESEQYVLLTSAKDLPVSGNRRPATPTGESSLGDRSLKHLLHAAEVEVDGGQVIDEVFEPVLQRLQFNINESTSEANPPASGDVGSQRPLAFANPLFQYKTSGRPPVSSTTSADTHRTKESNSTGGSSKQSVNPASSQNMDYPTPTRSSDVPFVHASGTTSLGFSSGYSSLSNECLHVAGSMEANTSDERKHYIQVRPARLPSPMSSSACDAQFFGSSGALSRSTEFPNEFSGTGMPLRRGQASSVVALDAPPDSPNCVGGSHGVGAGRKNNSGSQNNVRMGVRSVQRKVQEQEKTKLEYELESNMLRQQLQSLQSSLEDTSHRLELERAASERLNADWQQRLLNSEERHRRREEDITRLQLKLSQSEQDLSKSRAELANAHRTISEQRQMIHLYENASRHNGQPRSRFVSDSPTRPFTNFR